MTFFAEDSFSQHSTDTSRLGFTDVKRNLFEPNKELNCEALNVNVATIDHQTLHHKPAHKP